MILVHAFLSVLNHRDQIIRQVLLQQRLLAINDKVLRGEHIDLKVDR